MDEDDYYYRLQDAEKQIREDAVSEYIAGIAPEYALPILEYLPIRRNPQEHEYIEHLWRAYSVLDGGEHENMARSFAIMPFHLLYLLAVQYKLFRLFRWMPERYQTARERFVGREKNYPEIKNPGSVFDLGFFNEKCVFDFLGILGLEDLCIEEGKILVQERNDTIAHVKGKMEPNVEGKIARYLSVMNKIQKCSHSLNEAVADEWLEEVEEGEDMEEFFENRLASAYVSKYDFSDIVSIFLDSEKLHFEQWEQVVEKGFELAPDKTTKTLLRIADTHHDDAKRFNAHCILEERGII